MKKTILFLTVLGLSALRVMNAQHDTANGFDFIISDDGVWTWYNDERAAFKNDKLYTSYVKKNGRVGLSVNDIKTGANVGTETLLSNWFEKDDHNNASLLLRQDGKIMAFFTAHIREKVNYFRISNVNEPTQQSDWGAQVSQVTTNDSDNKGATYNNAYQLSAEAGKIYNFMRTNNFNPNFKEYLADGTPVRDGKDLILFQIGNGSVRPYLKCTSNNTDRIDFFFTDGHPVNVENNLYHCYYKTNADGSQGSIYQTDGTLITTMASVIGTDTTPGVPIQVSSVNKVYVFGSDGTQDRPWTHNINYDPVTGHPVVTYSKQRNINQITYHYAKWNGTQWNNYFVSDAGQGFVELGQEDYTGLITTNPYNTNEIFMSSNRNPITGIENNRYEIYSAITPDGGTTWNWTEVTSNSIQDNLRPYVPKGITTPEDRVVLWFYGNYISYLNYTTMVVGEYINKVYDGPAPIIPEPIPPIDTNIAYGVDINGRVGGNGAVGPTLNPFVAMDAVANASATDNGVTFTLFGSVEGSRDRGSSTPNNLVRDFVYAAGNGTSTGMRIENLPAGEYTFNSFHYDNDYAAPVTVVLREQGGAQIGNTIAIDNVETPASFTINAEAGKVYEVVATGTSSNGSRFNGLSIIDPNATIDVSGINLDINSEDNGGSNLTESGFEALVSPRDSAPTNNSITIDGVTITLGGNIAGSRNRGGDNNMIRDFIFGAVNSTETIVSITNLPAGSYSINSYHFDYRYPAPVMVTLREVGGATIGTVNLNENTDAKDDNQTPPIAGNSSDPASFSFTSDGSKTYELAIVGIDGSNGDTPNGRGPRFNGLEISSQALSTDDFSKTANNIEVFPNPFNNDLNIKSTANITKAKLYNVTGGLIKEVSLANQNGSYNFEIEGLPSGVYFLNIFENQNLLVVKKLIKE
ncbi:BNR-4 repeat-containing protein [Flavivirga eckloniae]|uniref:Secretion system C-terminal sorting domain-containing protein n=1 Tax=Flavivirga eckloniae TaxID=1803846 RepID=A0A2K9PPD9_9FLAO|nr:BNR-4 repeat-containing protein [Flavivirga eckloniae]AUP78905.1 hypothetical protein C1H87_09410 [Flavivirga eckloniae]